MLPISVKSNATEVLRELKGEQRALGEKALVRALNRTIDNMRAEAVRKLRETYNIKAGILRDQMRIERAYPGHLTAALVANGRAIPLVDFSARWSQRMAGASFSVKRGPRKTLPGTFIATMKSGHVGVFERKGSKRVPIEEKFSIGVPGMFGAREVQAAIESIALDRFTVNLASQVNLLFPS